jgi:hypothetical protein
MAGANWAIDEDDPGNVVWCLQGSLDNDTTSH